MFPVNPKFIFCYDGNKLGFSPYGENSVQTIRRLQNICQFDLFTNREYHRKNIHKNRTRFMYILTRENKLIRYTTKTNRCSRLVTPDYEIAFPKGAKCFYITVINGVEFIGTDESDVFRRAIRFNCGKCFEMMKIFLTYQYWPAYEFFAHHTENGKLVYDSIEYLRDFPRDDPEKLYWELTKHFTCETYTVDDAGHRSYARMWHWIDSTKGYQDFMNPTFYAEIAKMDLPIFWQHLDEDGVETAYEDYGFIE